MLVTRITEANAFAFTTPIEELWENRSANEIFLGLVDDTDSAVGVAMLEDTGLELEIRYFAIAEECRGRGYGKYFLERIFENFDQPLISRISCCLFVDEGKDSEFLSFLGHNGFQVDTIEGRRSVYDLFEVLQAAPFCRSSLSAAEKIIPARSAKDDIKLEIYALEDEAEAKGMILDARRMLSRENVFGGILLKDERISSMLAIMPFLDGVRIESIYASHGSLIGVMKLLDRAVQVIKTREDVPEKLYIDSVGATVLGFEDRLLSEKGVEPEAKMQAMIATKMFGGLK
ncbi:MAG: GNAT family N-acetyltransferase [Lachnospiraceae bacterium]|nr:GNAT family N-acetyltransferase [Lachnospiraceae bacterium]